MLINEDMNKKRLATIVICVSILIILIILTLFIQNKYRIPQYVLAIDGGDATAWVEYYEKNKLYFEYKKVYENKDGDLILVLSNKQRKKFKETMLSRMELAEKVLDDLNSELYINDSCTQIHVLCHTEDLKTIRTDYLDSIMVLAYYYQVFDGNNPNNINVTLVVRDKDSEIIIYESSIENYRK